MAECDAYKIWYHQHCMDIPPEVFDNPDVPWKCKKCEHLKPCVILRFALTSHVYYSVLVAVKECGRVGGQRCSVTS